MRHIQGTGIDPRWSAPQASEQLAANLSPSHLLHGVSPTVVLIVFGIVAVTLVVVGYLSARALWRGLARGRQRNREAMVQSEGRRARLFSGIGPQALVAAGGVAVSIHGLWGFATSTAHLPAALAVGFIGTFDAAEMILFGMLYRAADPKVGWTDELRLMHKTAWVLVSFSAAMNAVHAPNWWARPVLAAIPALAAWLIELQLRAKLADPEVDTSARPGPILLLRRIWQHSWSWVFAVLNLDANTTNGQISRGALAQRAAHQAYRLRTALQLAAALQIKAESSGQLSRSEQRQLRQLAPLRRRAQLALDNASMGVDSELTLDTFRRLTTLIRVDDVALIPGTPQETIAMAEELAVVPAAQLISASNRAAEEEEKAERSAAARLEAERARKAEEKALEEIRAQQRLANDARQEAEKIAREAAQIAVKAKAEAARSVDARQEAERAHQRSAAEISEMAEKTEALRVEAEVQQRAVQEAEGVLSRLREEIREQLPADLVLPVEVPVFTGSTGKQLAWEDYLKAVTEGRTPAAAAEIAAATGNAESTVRNWLVEFRQKRAEMIAAGLELVAERRASGTERQPSTARTGGLDHPAEASAGALIAGQRQGS